MPAPDGGTRLRDGRADVKYGFCHRNTPVVPAGFLFRAVPILSILPERSATSAFLAASIAPIGFGLAIVQFFEHLQQIPGVGPAHAPNAPRYLGLALISCGVLGLVVSIWQYRWTVLYMWGEPFASIAGMATEGMQSPVIAIAVLLVFIGFFAFAAVSVRLL